MADPSGDTHLRTMQPHERERTLNLASEPSYPLRAHGELQAAGSRSRDADALGASLGDTHRVTRARGPRDIPPNTDTLIP